MTAYCSQRSQNRHEEIKCEHLGEVEKYFVIYLVTTEIPQLINKAAGAVSELCFAFFLPFTTISIVVIAEKV